MKEPAQQYSETIEKLQTRIQILMDENRLLKERLDEAGISYADIVAVQELGVKVTIVTWHPDAYKYGRDDVRMELMERLRKAGFEIRLVEESCEHYAVIDRNIVWYGSMNLLSRVKEDDNLIRVKNRDAAQELMEMTFG
jgi:hypothetical protein